MQFVTGDDSLLQWTRALLGDLPTTAPQWATATEIKIAINRAYLRLRQIGGLAGTEQTTKRTYADAVASQIFYQKPADFVGLQAIELSKTGANLATATITAAEIIYPDPWTAEKALQAYNTGDITAVGERTFLQGDHFGLVSPPTSTQAGTNSIRILYNASTAELSGDGDEPEVPRPFQDMICQMAAIELKGMRDMDASHLYATVYGRGQFDTSSRMWEYRVAMQTQIAMHEDTIATQGLRQQPSPVVSGTVSRTVKGKAANDVY